MTRGLAVGALGVGASPLRHGQRGAAALREVVRHVVHELVHQEDAAPGGIHQVLLGNRIGETVGIETVALIGDGDTDAIVGELEHHVHTRTRLLLVAMNHGVGHRLADRRDHPIDFVSAEADLFDQVLRKRVHRIQELTAAANPELYRTNRAAVAVEFGLLLAHLPARRLLDGDNDSAGTAVERGIGRRCC